MDASPALAVTTVLVSAAVGGITAWVALRRRADEDLLARATRRTAALQLLSDEAFTVIRVRDECQNMRYMVQLRKEQLGANHEHLASEADQIYAEAKDLVRSAQERRQKVAPQIQAMNEAEIEAVIAEAHHGKRLAEAQLERTLLSMSEVLREYGVCPAGRT